MNYGLIVVVAGIFLAIEIHLISKVSKWYGNLSEFHQTAVSEVCVASVMMAALILLVMYT